MIKSVALSVSLLLGFAGIAHAQSDALTKCLADNTTAKDRKDLSRWLFVAISAHPEMQDLAVNSQEANEQAYRAMGVIVTRLLTESCLREVRAVFKSGQGSQAMDGAFEALGRLAMLELT
jgi:hypothetical protein